MAAGALTVTDQNFADKISRPVRKVSLVWVSDASGDVNGNLTNYLSGQLVRVVFIPSSTAAPTANYDVVLNDESGLDILAGQGANLSATVTTHIAPGVALKDGVTTSTTPPQIDDRLDLVVTNAGNAKGGTVILYLR